MTSEELLIPRYKVISDYPNSEFVLNQILIPVYNEKQKSFYYTGYDADGSFTYSELQLKEYPHLFKKLEWWEETEEKDMPQYLKSVNGKEVYRRVSRIDGAQNAIVQYEKGIYGSGTIGPIGLLNLLPATEQEYNDYITAKNKP